MGIKEDYQQAQQLAKQGQLEDARNLLIVHDHAKTNALLARINKALDNKGQSATQDSDKSFTAKLVISIVLLFFFFVPGLIAISIFSKEAKQYPNAAGAKGLIMLNRFMFGLIALALVLVVILLLGIVFQ